VKNEPQKIRAVLDTNVLISALVFGGTPRNVTDLIAQKTIRPVMSEEILSELRRIIITRFPEYTLLVEGYEKLLRRYAIWAPLGSKTITVSRDPDDNKVIETAVIAKCHFIISGDKDLLVLKSYEDIKIVKPIEFLRQISVL
jgi:putative PIN family toxin of toxin-antitoxin system